MKNLSILIVALVLFSMCNTQNENSMSNENPFFSEYQTPFGVPPFDLIQTEHFLPALEAFKETGDLFDQKTARAFRTNILSKGGTEDLMELYLKFRGSKPGIDPLLKKRGLK